MKADNRLEYLPFIVDYLSFCKYIRRYFKPESYKGTDFDGPTINIDNVDEMFFIDDVCKSIDILLKDFKISYEHVDIEDLHPNEEIVYEFIENLDNDGYHIFYIVRLPFLRELKENDHELYEKVTQMMYTDYTFDYSGLIECFVGGDTSVELLNGNHCIDLLIFAQASYDGIFDFFRDFHSSFEKAINLYHTEYRGKIDDNLSKLLNTPKEELFHESND